jgi:hypothetical protein
MTFLDTNFLVFALVPGTAEDQRLRALISGGETINISAVAWTEFLCGPVAPDQLKLAEALFPTPEAFLSQDSVRAANLFNGTGRGRGSLAD